MPGMWEQAGDTGLLERRLFPVIGVSVLVLMLVAGILFGSLARWQVGRSSQTVHPPTLAYLPAATATSWNSKRAA